LGENVDPCLINGIGNQNLRHVRRDGGAVLDGKRVNTAGYSRRCSVDSNGEAFGGSLWG
jgi:hypothetical protein